MVGAQGSGCCAALGALGAVAWGVDGFMLAAEMQGAFYQQIESLHKQTRKWMATAPAINRLPGQGQVTAAPVTKGDRDAWVLSLCSRLFFKAQGMKML